jgi:CPA2 family monovalent cation:H+ antiporter-2
MRFMNPTIQLIVRTRYLRNVAYLEQKGADIVVPEEMQTTVRLFSHVLNAYMIPEEEIDRYIQKVRANDYEIMRSSLPKNRPRMLDSLDEEGLHTRTVTVREDSAISGKTLQELNLRNKYGLSVLAVKRGDKTIGNPAANMYLDRDDRLVIVGTADQFEKSLSLFRDNHNHSG